ncbi:hypothetical protein KUF71_015245 [Frankliniella fusca]|uniref:Secreted protein n=1 Tax=Frankliniella fusca TaxID=407009 RepID=A0AAE1HT33_9NEOP|nr:hypothetical protein KUF71_015245 [Frankliniella fusca]
MLLRAVLASVAAVLASSPPVVFSLVVSPDPAPDSPVLAGEPPLAGVMVSTACPGSRQQRRHTPLRRPDPDPDPDPDPWGPSQNTKQAQSSFWMSALEVAVLPSRHGAYKHRWTLTARR